MANTGTTYDIVVGWTAAVDIDLRSDGQIPSSSLVGTVTFILHDINGNTLPFTGSATILDAVNWRIRLIPLAADFGTAGVFRARISVTDSFSRTAYFPNGAWDTWVVHAA